MRILLSLHSMEIGGSQLNGLELAEVLQTHGHDLLVYGPDGVLNERARASGMRVIRAPEHSRVPNIRSSARLCRIVRDEGIDLVHAYEWNAIIDAMYGPGWCLGTPVIGTVLSMDVPYFIPKDVPLIVGTRKLRSEQSWHRPDVRLMEPPIDTVRNAPYSPLAIADLRETLRVSADELLIVVVSRLAERLKLEGLLSAIEVIGDRSSRRKERLVIVGGGPSARIVQRAAAEANKNAGRDVVTLTGEQTDPRPFYAATDVVLGMGGSALKGMAFAKPLIVQGECGFWELLDENTLPVFQWQGWYGKGSSRRAGQERLSMLLDRLEARTTRDELGAFGRNVVANRYDLNTAAHELSAICESVGQRRSTRTIRARQLGASTVTLIKRAAYRNLPHRLRRRGA